MACTSCLSNWRQQSMSPRYCRNVLKITFNAFEYIKFLHLYPSFVTFLALAEFATMPLQDTLRDKCYCQNFTIINLCHILAHYSRPKILSENTWTPTASHLQCRTFIHTYTRSWVRMVNVKRKEPVSDTEHPWPVGRRRTAAKSYGLCHDDALSLSRGEPKRQLFCGRLVVGEARNLTKMGYVRLSRSPGLWQSARVWRAAKWNWGEIQWWRRQYVRRLELN